MVKRIKQLITFAFLVTLFGVVIYFSYIYYVGTQATGGIFTNKEESADQVQSVRYIKLGGAVVGVDVADTPELRRQGLSGRESLDTGEGMLFVFEQEGVHTFWMKDMNFSIDIIWFDKEGVVVDIAAHAEPEGAEPSRIYRPRDAAQYVLEVPAGWSAEHNIVIGDRFVFCKTKECLAGEVLEIVDLLNEVDRVGEDTAAAFDEKIMPAPAPTEQEEAVDNAEPEKPEVLKESPSPAQIMHTVPFTAQAPFGQWSDARQQDGCEEASIIMIRHWITDEPIALEKALEEILALSAYEEKNWGYFEDTSAVDTVRLLKEYYSIDTAVVVSEVSIESIKRELAAGNLVIVPMDGRDITNPYYSGDGPSRHMIVVIGYDDEKKQFITNDPGTRRGAGFRYDYDEFFAGVRDYPSGHDTSMTEEVKAMIVVRKS